MKIGRLLALGSLASLSPLVEFSSRFGRTILLSHGLSPTEFGIGAAITLVIAIAELTTDIGLDRFLILRADDPDRALAAVHGVSLIRGALLAALVLLAAPWIAEFLGAPDSVASFRAVAGIIFLHACTNLEMKQVQRDLRYGPDAKAQITEHTLAFLSIYPAIRLFGDHRAVLAMLLVQYGAYVAVSHLVAQRRYRITFRGGAIAREAVRYGLPLTLNGLGVAVIGQLDRAIVSHWFGIQTLALYTVILNLTVIPISGIQRILSQLGMSLLARERGHAENPVPLYFGLIWAFALAGAGYALFVAATASALAPALFGAIYRIPPLFHILITVIVWLRISRGAQNLMLLFSGDTRRLMLSNLIGCVWPAVALPALVVAPRLETVVAALLVGELLSLAGFIASTRSHLSGAWQPLAGEFLGSGVVVCLACLGIAVAGMDAWRLAAFGVALLLLMALLVQGREHLRRAAMGLGG